MQQRAGTAAALALLAALSVAAANGLMAPVTAIPGGSLVSPARIRPGSASNIDAVAVCYPTAIGYSSGQVTSNGTKVDNDLRFESPAKAAGFVKFDLSALPIGSIVASVTLNYYCYSQSGSPGTYTRQITSDPVTAPGSTLWTQATTGTQLDNNRYNSVGWMTKAFNAAGIWAVQSCIAQGWIGCGWHAWESRAYWGNAYGWNPAGGPTYRPYLTVTYSTGSPDLVIEQVAGTGFAPGSGPTGQTVPELVIRNIGTTSYPAGNVTFQVRESRPMLQPATSWSVNAPLIAPGAGLPISGMVYTPANARPGAIEYTWAITATATPEPAADNQSTVLVRYYDTTASRYHIDEAFGDGPGDWTVAGTGTRWDTTRQLPPQFPYPTMPPTVPGNHSELVVMTDSKSGNYQNSDSVEFVNTTACDLSGRTAAFLSWCEKYNTETGYDFCAVKLSTDNGMSWATVRRVSGNNPSWPDWDTVRLDLGDYAGQASVKVKFLLTSDFLVNYDGWYVDDIVLATAGMPDVQTVSIDAPTGSVNRGTTITPKATVKNNGRVPASFAARFRITDGYAGTATATNLAPGESVQLSFSPGWTSPTPGAFATKCSTELAGDPNPGNDMVTRSVFVQVVDGAVARLVAPTGTMDSGAVVQPRARIKNLGTVAFGGVTARFDVSLGGFSNTKPVANLVPGDSTDVTFDNWTAAGRGAFATRCTLTCAGDMDPSNNQLIGGDTVNVHDLTARNITAPTGTVSPGSTIAPAALVRNSGTLREACKAFFRINCAPPYAESVTLGNGLPSAADTTLTFPGWTVVGLGPLTATCSLYVTSEQKPADNVVSQGFSVGGCDIGPTAILAPVGSHDTNEVIAPRARVRNFGSLTAVGARIVFRIDSTPGNMVYADTLTSSLAPGAESTFLFDAWLATNVARTYSAFCSTWVAGDTYQDNDTISGSFTLAIATPGWYSKSPMPTGAKPIKDGGWLTYDAGRARIYASRGNKQLDFFEYDPASDSWKALAPWLPGTEGKPPSKGSAGCADGSGGIYATKGNNRLGFWKYDAPGNTWTQKRDVPLGLSNKKVKGGTDIVWAYKGSLGSPYLLKGYKNEFYRYDVAGDSFQTLAPAPVGTRGKWDKGSWLAYDDVNRKIYAHKATYHEFYRYSPDGDSWSGPLTAMPIPGSAGNKKSKDGSCGVYSGGSIFALKGGNTQEFWKYAIMTNSWAEKETIPKIGTTGKKKKVKSGADIAAVDRMLYATKGNKSNELWQYVPGASLFEMPEHEGVTSTSFTVDRSSFTISPNPLVCGFATVRLSPLASHLSPQVFSLYDAAGRCVLSRPVRTSSFILDASLLPVGVYVCRLSAGNLSAATHLVVIR